ncbi:hypothetical protein HG536_0D01030 [Torulaspora globosa]|uniref:Transcription activator GCR1-like domain-containing protein n=1 Tax=Torulaspora globosa TaxID=48254 RepID=A0A7G3ZGE5_9SACH|nr:uncharacterized protein HG536_0D01030 [Torulaspora globosa]QLL32581.1 hypothetical protein HG536_0D01030 [Torulaspora globosa]
MVNLNLPNRTAPMSSTMSSSYVPNYRQSSNINNSNQLQNLLKKQDQQARVSNTNISSNFHIITQYILQSYFKVDFDGLQSLKVVDLIVDQTYPDSITLRKLNENTSIKPYEYFNTISRDEDITRCPIFAMAIYFVIRWSHPNPPISIRTFNDIPLLDPSFITNSSANILSNLANTATTNSRCSRSKYFEPPPDLIGLIFPWLFPLKQDLLLIDRTNYKLNSFIELFEFFATTIIQDLRHLQNHPMLLPNIVSFVTKFIPDLFINEEFKSRTAAPDNFKLNDNDDNDMFNDNDSRFLELSRRFTTENIRLSQQITNLRSDLSSVQLVCDQILQMQKQLISTTQQTSALKDFKQNQTIDGNGVIILDRNTLNSSMLSSLVQSIENSQQQLKQPSNNFSVSQVPQQQQQVQQTDASFLAPVNMFPSLSNPISSMFTSQQQQQQQQQLQNQRLGLHVQDPILKRKLPLPTSAPPTGTGPFSPSPGPATVNANPDSPFNKRFRFDEKATPSQTALDSLLSKSIGSPKFPNVPGPGAGSNNGIPSRFSSRFATPSTFAIPGSPSEAAQGLPLNSVVSYPGQSSLQSQQTGQSVSVPNRPNEEPAKNIESEPTSQASQVAAASGESPSSASKSNPGSDQRMSVSRDAQSSGSSDDKSLSPKLSTEREISTSKKSSQTGEKLGPNRHIKYKLSRENKTIWDLYTEWYIGLNGKPSIKNLIEDYGWRRWKVSDDSHFFPTRRIIIEYIENECDRGIKLGRFTNPDQSREEIRKILVADLEKFRINNALTLNSLSMYFKNLTKENKEICIFDNFEDWTLRAMTEDEKVKYCKRQHLKDNPSEGASDKPKIAV